MNGVALDKFAPNEPVTREQMVTILYRYAVSKGTAGDAKADLNSFPDAKQVSSYAKDAVAWAVARKIIQGSNVDGKDYLLPADTATRAQIATVLMRFLEA